MCNMSEETKVERKENVTKQRKPDNEINKVVISGIIKSELEYSHNVKWEEFYQTHVIVERLSGTKDSIPIIISKLLIKSEMMNTSLKGKFIEAEGQFRSLNRKGHLILFLFVTKVNICEKEEELTKAKDENSIYLDGYLCKPPVFRKRKHGREITQLHIAVNRGYGRSDYIPCIVWGRAARRAKEFHVGNRIQLYGRIQSRKYFNKYLENPKEVYEVSVRDMNIVEE